MPKIKPLQPSIYTQLGEVADMQQKIEEFAKQLEAPDFLSGILLEGVELSTTAKSVAHGLGRVPAGYFVLKRNAGAVIYNTASSSDSLYLTMLSTAPVTATLWIF